MKLDYGGFSYCLVNCCESRLTAEHHTPYVREAAAKALATALPSKPDLFDVYLNKFMELYHEKVLPFLSCLTSRQNRYHRSTTSLEW